MIERRIVKNYQTGFTLAEILIAIGLMGVIAMFTIPKVLDTNASYNAQKSKAIAKAFISNISNAYTRYKLDNAPSPTTQIKDITPYMNYIKIDTSNTQIDDNPGETTISCSLGWNECMVFADGSIVTYDKTGNWADTQTTRAVWFQFDPNGKVDNGTTADGPGKGLHIRLYYDGRIKTKKDMLNNTCSNSGCEGPNVAQEPSWFTFN